MSKSNKKVLLIVPAYNEAKSILDVYKMVQDNNKKNNLNYDIIVINDGSKDDTSKICHENGIPVVDSVMNLGIGGAVQTGYKYAYYNNYDVAVQIDGDGQHDVSYVEKVIEPLINGEADMSIGSRYIDKSKEGFKSTAARRLGINIISAVIKFKSGKKIYDTTSGFRAANKKVIELFANDYPLEYPEPISTADLINKGYVIKEIPVVMKERQAGNSSISSYKNIYYMVNVILSILLLKRGK